MSVRNSGVLIPKSDKLRSGALRATPGKSVCPYWHAACLRVGYGYTTQICQTHENDSAGPDRHDRFDPGGGGDGGGLPPQAGGARRGPPDPVVGQGQAGAHAPRGPRRRDPGFRGHPLGAGGRAGAGDPHPGRARRAGRAQHRPAGAAQSRAGAGAVQRRDGMGVNGDQAGGAESAAAGDLLQKKADLRGHKANYDQAKLQLEVDEKEFENDLISLQRIRLSRASVDQTKNLLEINQKCLEMYERETLPAQLAETEATVRKARSLLRAQEKQVESLHVRAGDGRRSWPRSRPRSSRANRLPPARSWPRSPIPRSSRRS